MNKTQWPRMAKRPLFTLGLVVATPGALAALEKTGQPVEEFIDRHITGDWGDVTDEDKESNDSSARKGYRVLSAYHLQDGTKIWVITEADRSATTLLLPSEY